VQPLSTPFDRISENLSKLWFEQVSFPRAARRQEADLAHVPHWGSSLRPAMPTVVTIHDLIPLLLPSYRGNFLVRSYTRLVSAAARRSAGVITVSRASQQDIVKHLRIPATRVWVTHEAAPPFFRRADGPQIEAVRQKHALPEAFLLYLGGFDVRKNVSGLLSAFARLQEREGFADARLVVAGRLPKTDSEFTPDPRRIARELAIEHRVTFTGWIDEADKPSLYTAATGFVFPSLYEGFGLPVLEALACGTPTITSDVSSLPEVVGQAGLLVSPGNEAELTAAMESLLLDSTLREKLQHMALEQADRFSWQQTAQATVGAYDHALALA
jgi:glycosyltransferase involved in cell wall biosynthesis